MHPQYSKKNPYSFSEVEEKQTKKSRSSQQYTRILEEAATTVFQFVKEGCAQYKEMDVSPEERVGIGYDYQMYWQALAHFGIVVSPEEFRQDLYNKIKEIFGSAIRSTHLRHTSWDVLQLEILPYETSLTVVHIWFNAKAFLPLAKPESLPFFFTMQSEGQTPSQAFQFTPPAKDVDTTSKMDVEPSFGKNL